MVRRTVVVLGILSLVLVAATCFGFGRGGCEADSKPLYVPVDCPPVADSKMIIQKWSAKIEGPCPPPMPAIACDSGRRGRRGGDGLLSGLGAAIVCPVFDGLFGGRGGVYGCSIRGGRGDGPCGPFYGPLAKAVVAVPRSIASPTTGVFGVLW